jgi:hypothetical protein
VIEGYLSELGRALHATRRERRRILAEVEDHLRESAVEHGEQEAIRRFGAVEVVAERFRLELAADAAAWSVRLAGVVLVVFLGLCVAIQTAPVRAASPRSLDAPFGPLMMVLLEIAGFVAALTAVRWWRWRRAPEIPPGAALALARGSWVAASAACGGGAMQLVAVMSPSPVHGAGLAVTVGGLATCVAASAALGPIAVALKRVRLIGGTVPSDGFDDLVTVADATPVVGGLVNALARRGDGGVARLAAALSPRRRPWRFALAFALAVGVAFAVVKGLSEPDGRWEWAALRGGLTLAGAQAAIVLVAYALLGRFLGLRPGRRSSRRSSG